MDSNFTQLISYDEICVDEIDLYEDAMGFNTEFIDVIQLLGKMQVEPGEALTEELIDKIRALN